MSINWVMLDPATKSFVPLPHERILYTSPPRTSISLTTPNTYPGRTPLNLSSPGGKAYITNRRILFLPITTTPQLSSFTAPHTHLHDTHVSTPIFGANSWVAILKPVPNGGIPPQHTFVELKLTFKDGGAFDWHTCFEGVRERLAQVREVARESGSGSGSGSGGGDADGGVDWEVVGGEGLPAYEPAATGTTAATGGGGGISGGGGAAAVGGNVNTGVNSAGATDSTRRREEEPDEPPPGYEEVQEGGAR